MLSGEDEMEICVFLAKVFLAVHAPVCSFSDFLALLQTERALEDLNGSDRFHRLFDESVEFFETFQLGEEVEVVFQDWHAVLLGDCEATTTDRTRVRRWKLVCFFCFCLDLVLGSFFDVSLFVMMSASSIADGKSFKRREQGR